MTAMLHVLAVLIITHTSPTLLPMPIFYNPLHIHTVLCCTRRIQQRSFPLRVMDSGGRIIGDSDIIFKLVLYSIFIGHSSYWKEVLFNASNNWDTWSCLLLLIISFIMFGGTMIFFVRINRGTSVQVISYEKVLITKNYLMMGSARIVFLLLIFICWQYFADNIKLKIICCFICIHRFVAKIMECAQISKH